MAFVIYLNDLNTLLPFYDMRVVSRYSISRDEDRIAFLTRCAKCGETFDMEVAISCDDELVFTFEDMLCPNSCNQAKVAFAGCFELTDLEELQDIESISSSLQFYQKHRRYPVFFSTSGVH